MYDLASDIRDTCVFLYICTCSKCLFQVTVASQDRTSRDTFYRSLVDIYRKLSQIPKLTTRLLDVCNEPESQNGARQTVFLPDMFATWSVSDISLHVLTL